jgi:hypothetical protein
LGFWGNELKFKVGLPVSDPELASLVNSELFAEVEPELSDFSEDAATKAKTQE